MQLFVSRLIDGFVDLPDFLLLSVIERGAVREKMNLRWDSLE